MSIIHTFIVPHPPLIIPEIGKGEESKISETIKAYDEIAEKIGDLKPDTIVITTPHSIMYADYIHVSPGKGAKGDFREFGQPNVSFETEYDVQLADKLSVLAANEGIPAGTLGEKKKSLDHGTMIPLYFVNKYYKDYKVVRCSISGLSFEEHYQFGKCISKAAEELDRKAVLIASGDLSHRLKEDGPYGFAKEGPIFDRQVTSAMSHGDFLAFLNFDMDFCHNAGECGLRSIIIMAGALDGKAVKSQLLSYEGPFGVGYAVAAFDVIGDDNERHFDRIYKQKEEQRLNHLKENEDEYVRLARRSLESYILHNKRIDKPKDLSKEVVNQKAGVFVSLKMKGQLRGCIGTIAATTDSIADEIIQNAISAGLEDPRFSPVSSDELAELEYSVDILGASEPIKSIRELDTQKYGVIVSNGYKRGLLLPNLEGINTPEEQVNIALKKAGIKPTESYQMERFEVVRHK